MRTIAPYLTSRRNLAGSGLALLAAALLVIDPVGPQGIVLVIGFYLAGVLAVRRTPKVHRLGFDPVQLQRSLLKEIAAVAGRVPPEVWIRIQRIEMTTRAEILTRLDCLPCRAALASRPAPPTAPWSSAPRATSCRRRSRPTCGCLPATRHQTGRRLTTFSLTSSTCSRPRCGGGGGAVT